MRKDESFEEPLRLRPFHTQTRRDFIGTTGRGILGSSVIGSALAGAQGCGMFTEKRPNILLVMGIG
jgi:hypothetical protein